MTSSFSLLTDQSFANLISPMTNTLQGEELYSNYGRHSNEKLLFAYGFAAEMNPYDSVAVSLTAGVNSSSNNANTNVSSSTSTHYIERGGVIPEVTTFISTTIII